jgi:EAL domain-containing protein (putative c-di-GMP-specific phosphodiesterase class I)
LVAAGIEQASQFDSLRGESGVAGQGYFFARPLSELDAEALLIEPNGAWERSERN